MKLSEQLKRDFGEAMGDYIEKAEELERNMEKFRKALVSLLGVETKEDLQQMELIIRKSEAPISDKVAAVNAIHALLSVAG